MLKKIRDEKTQQNLELQEYRIQIEPLENVNDQPDDSIQTVETSFVTKGEETWQITSYPTSAKMWWFAKIFVSIFI